MLLVYFFSILKQLSLYVSDLNIKGSSKKDFSLIKSSSEHIKLCCKIKKLLFSSIIQQFELWVRECFQLFKVVSLLFAQVTGLLYTWFHLTRSWLSRDEVVSRVLQDANPTEPAHAFSISTVVFHLLFWVVGTSFGESLRDLIWCKL